MQNYDLMIILLIFTEIVVNSWDLLHAWLKIFIYNLEATVIIYQITVALLQPCSVNNQGTVTISLSFSKAGGFLRFT